MTAGEQAAAAREVPVHWLRPNHREWTPPQVICFDTETRATQTDAGELHQLRLWAARLDVRRARRQTQLGTVTSWGRTAAQLAAQVDVWCAGQTVMWSYAHNLSFDLTTTRLPAELERIGWAVTDHAVSSDTPWLRMRKDRCVLTMADSWGWLRAGLAAIGADVGYEKPPLPDWDHSEQAWRQRCEADTEILARAMLQLMAWWDAAHLGSWALTGSAAGWNVMRHSMPAKSMLIVTDPEQVAADRAAVYGGRRQAFSHGQQDGGPFDLADFSRAYTVICRDHPLPVRRRGNFPRLDTDSPLICGDRYGIIAEVEIETDTPRWPVRAAGRVAYPVGRFRTVLAGPDIAEARRLGALRSVGAGWLHELGTPMQAWADWCLRQQAAPDDVVPPVAKRALRHWGRAVPGKSAAHGWDKRDAGEATHGGWHYEPIWDAGRHAAGHLIEVGGRVTEVVQTNAGDNAYPAILAFIEAWVRVYLGRAIDAAGQDQVLSCDTDGFIARASSGWQDLTAAADLGPLTLRHKATWQELTIWGPQHYQSEEVRRLAGIPRKAMPNADGSLEATLWPKLAWQMGREAADGYLRPTQTYRVAESYVTGWVLADGTVAPLQAAICPCGTTILLPFQDTPAAAAGAELGGAQAAHLAAMITQAAQTEGPCKYHSCKSAGTDTGSAASSRTTSWRSALSQGIRVAARAGRWPIRGHITARKGPRELYGWILTLWPTPTTWAPCTRPSPRIRCRSGWRGTSCGPPRPAVTAGYGDTGRGRAPFRR